MKRAPAELVREYGPFPGVEHVRGVTCDGQQVWFAAGDKLQALDPKSGEMLRSIDVAAHAGTAFDGQYLYQIAEDRIQKIDPNTGRVLATIPAPGGGADSGLAWHEGTLWVGQYRERRIHQIDPRTGEVLRTIESKRFVTGVTWVDGELWYGTLEGDKSDLRQVEPRTGAVLQILEMPPGVGVSGLESDGADRFLCGGGRSGKIRAVRRPKRASASTRRQPTSHERLSGRSWDASYHEGPAPWDIGRAQPAIVRLASAGGFAGAVLDAGCGTGENALHLASLGLSVLGVDVAGTALAIARAKADDRGIEVEFAAADAFQLARLGRKFDTVLDCGLFHTFDGDERPRYVASMAAVTERASTLYVLCFSDEGADSGPHPVSQEELRAAFHPGNGWNVAAIEPERLDTRFHDHGAPAWLATIKRI